MYRSVAISPTVVSIWKSSPLRRDPSGCGHYIAVAAGLAKHGPEDRGFDRPEELARLYYEHVRAVRSYVAHHHLRRDVDDIVQETFIVAGRKLAALEPGRERAWLLGIARNLLRNARKGNQRRDRFLDALVAARPRAVIRLADEHVLTEQIEPLLRAFATLSPEDQEILLLAGWEELSAAEMAEVMGISAQRASDRLYKARARLRERFEGEALL